MAAAGRPVPGGRTRDLAQVVATLLAAGTYGSIALFAVGLLAMILAGIGPLDGAPEFDPAMLLTDLAAGGPAAFAWLGILFVVVTPTARVITALVGFARGGERDMAVIAAAILAVITSSVLLAILAEA